VLTDPEVADWVVNCLEELQSYIAPLSKLATTELNEAFGSPAFQQMKVIFFEYTN
jgi:hypothetical protein